MTAAALGYGCAALMGRTPRKESVALLETAFDAGVTHFDVARSYGYGEAESALGDFLRLRREQVTVTTKLGISPPARSRRLAVAKAAARRLGPLSGALRRAARGRAQEMQTAGNFGVASARQSLETSLWELGTERVDFLLLHECGPGDLSDELLDYLRGRVGEGVIGAFGVASRPEQTRALLSEAPDFAPTVQVADNVTERVLEELPATAGRTLFTHSALGAALDAVHAHVSGSPVRSAEWARELEADCTDREQLGRLMLAWARCSNAGGTVLFSSRNRDRIRMNAGRGLPDAAIVERFADLVRAELGGAG